MLGREVKESVSLVHLVWRHHYVSGSTLLSPKNRTHQIAPLDRFQFMTFLERRKTAKNSPEDDLNFVCACSFTCVCLCVYACRACLCVHIWCVRACMRAWYQRGISACARTRVSLSLSSHHSLYRHIRKFSINCTKVILLPQTTSFHC